MSLLTREQVESRKEKAVRFISNVLEDDARADKVEAESVEDYADRKRITITNPRRKPMTKTAGSTKSELQKEVRDYEKLFHSVSEKVDELLNPLLTREQLVESLQEVEELLAGDEDEEEIAEEEDEEED